MAEGYPPDERDDQHSARNIFREYEKFYRTPPTAKRKHEQKTTDFRETIDFANLAGNTPQNQALIQKITVQSTPSNYFQPFHAAYAVSSVPGLVFIPNPFTEVQQKYWIQRCMKEFIVANPTNISNLQGNKELWSCWKQDYMKELRWASLGYHFQWTQRIYSEEFKGEFPSDLNGLVQDVARQFDYEMTAEAAIVNFYPHPRCVMGGHLDDAEEDMSKPIVSYSFGNTIIFLIGGKTRDIPPVAMYVRSGDVVLMGGHSRYCYHGVPRMLEGTCPSFLSDDPSSDWNDCREYIRDARINMNCRQVMRAPGTTLISS